MSKPPNIVFTYALLICKIDVSLHGLICSSRLKNVLDFVYKSFGQFVYFLRFSTDTAAEIGRIRTADLEKV